VGGDVPVNNEALLVTDFVNFKIKSAQFFRDGYRNMICVHMLNELHLYCVKRMSCVCF
jgi:hypothetical protein